MKKILLSIFVAILVTAIFSCSKHEVFLINHPDDVTETRFDPIYGGGLLQDWLVNNDTTMVFGPQLANPYNVDVMRQALATIREEDPDFFFPTINTSHYYVRFRPDSYEQMCDLFARDTSIIYLDFPLDREVVSGNSYHDPSIVDTLPTYQYASIRTTKWANLINGFDIDYEILDELFIPDNAGLTIIGVNPGIGDITPIIPGDSTIWGHPTFPDNVADPASVGASVTWTAVNALEDMAYLITGNSDDDETETNGTIASPASTTAETMSAGSNGRWTPSGRIRAYDDVKGGLIPLEGVKVIVYRGCNTKKCYTDSNGNFTCSGSFKNKANYKIKWESDKWDIRDGWNGQAYYNGPKSNGEWILDIGNSNGKSLRYATIHRALYRMFYGNTGGLSRPGWGKTKVAYLHKKSGQNIAGDYWLDLGMNMFPDIRIYGKNSSNVLYPTQRIYRTTSHELGHSAHWFNVPINYTIACINGLRYVESWAECVEYYLTLLEYDELGLKEELQPTTTVGINNVAKWVLPDQLNKQEWTTTQGDEVYTPFFIDILDSFNQYMYYKALKTYSIDYNFNQHPNDAVAYNDILSLEDIVFGSTSFERVVDKLIDKFEETGNTMAITNLNTLYTYYD